MFRRLNVERKHSDTSARRHRPVTLRAHETCNSTSSPSATSSSTRHTAKASAASNTDDNSPNFSSSLNDQHACWKEWDDFFIPPIPQAEQPLMHSGKGESREGSRTLNVELPGWNSNPSASPPRETPTSASVTATFPHQASLSVSHPSDMASMLFGIDGTNFFSADVGSSTSAERRYPAVVSDSSRDSTPAEPARAETDQRLVNTSNSHGGGKDGADLEVAHDITTTSGDLSDATETAKSSSGDLDGSEVNRDSTTVNPCNDNYSPGHLLPATAQKRLASGTQGKQGQPPMGAVHMHLMNVRSYNISQAPPHPHRPHLPIAAAHFPGQPGGARFAAFPALGPGVRLQLSHASNRGHQALRGGGGVVLSPGSSSRMGNSLPRVLPLCMPGRPMNTSMRGRIHTARLSTSALRSQCAPGEAPQTSPLKQSAADGREVQQRPSPRHLGSGTQDYSSQKARVLDEHLGNSDGEGSSCPSSPRRSRAVVGFKTAIAVIAEQPAAGPESTMNSLVTIRNPTFRERGREHNTAPDETRNALLHRTRNIQTIAVVEEDAVADPFMVVCGSSVRVYTGESEGDHARDVVTVSSSEIEKPMKRLRGNSFPNDLGSGLTTQSGLGSDSTMSHSKSSMVQELDTTQAPPRETISRSSNHSSDSSDSDSNDFDRYKYNFQLDEAISRQSGADECDSEALNLLLKQWIEGRHAALFLGNTRGRNSSSFSIAKSFLANALDAAVNKWRERGGKLEVTMSMGEIGLASTPELPGGELPVRDMLADLSASAGNAASQIPEYPQTELVWSPLLGRFVNGLSKIIFTGEETTQLDHFFTRAFFKRPGNPNSTSQSGSFSSVLSSSGSLGGGSVVFVQLFLKQMDDTASQAAKGERRDTLVSSLQLILFGGDSSRLSQLLANATAPAPFAFAGDIGSQEDAWLDGSNMRSYCMAKKWTSTDEFLVSLTQSALTGATHTVMCATLSDYNKLAPAWLQVLADARRVSKCGPRTGSAGEFLSFLDERLTLIRGHIQQLEAALYESGDSRGSVRKSTQDVEQEQDRRATIVRTWKNFLSYLVDVIEDVNRFCEPSCPAGMLPLCSCVDMTFDDAEFLMRILPTLYGSSNAVSLK